MHEYLTRRMVAIKPRTYLGQDLQPGDEFIATPHDGDYFTRTGWARDAENAAPTPAPTSAPTPAPTPEYVEQPAAQEMSEPEETPAWAREETPTAAPRRGGRRRTSSAE